MRKRAGLHIKGKDSSPRSAPACMLHPPATGISLRGNLTPQMVDPPSPTSAPCLRPAHPLSFLSPLPPPGPPAQAHRPCPLGPRAFAPAADSAHPQRTWSSPGCRPPLSPSTRFQSHLGLVGGPGHRTAESTTSPGPHPVSFQSCPHDRCQCCAFISPIVSRLTPNRHGVPGQRRPSVC